MGSCGICGQMCPVWMSLGIRGMDLYCIYVSVYVDFVQTMAKKKNSL